MALLGPLRDRRRVQLALALPRLDAQVMARVGLRALEFSGAGPLEPLRGRPVGLHLRHDDSCRVMASASLRWQRPAFRPRTVLSAWRTSPLLRTRASSPAVSSPPASPPAPSAPSGGPYCVLPSGSGSPPLRSRPGP